MKKLLALFLATVIATSFIISPAGAIVVAPSDWTMYDYGYVDALAVSDLSLLNDTSTIKVVVNNTIVEFPDAQPFVDANSRTMIPIRAVTEAMGADVSWDSSSKTAIIERGGIRIEIPIGSAEFTVTTDDEIRVESMDTQAVIKDGRTYVPIRYIAETLGAVVDWSPLYKAVEIIYTEELSWEEIKRLRSYPVFEKGNYTQQSKDAFLAIEGNEKHLTFTGTYGFSNSHFYAWTNESIDGWKHALNDIAATIVLPERNSADIAAAMVQYTRDYAKTGDYLGPVSKNMYSDDMSKARYSCGMTTKESDTYTYVKKECRFRTDNSLSYRNPYGKDDTLSVRGILEITFFAPTPLDYIRDSYGIEDPEYGVTYYIDVDMTVFLSFGYISSFGDGALYRLDTESGKPMQIGRVPIDRYI